MSFYSLLLHKCDIYRPTTSAGIYGEDLKSSEILIKADVACRFAEKRERKVFTDVSESLIATRYLLLIPSDSTAQERDIIRNIELDYSTTVSGPFVIETFMNRFSSALHHKSAILRLVDQ